VGGEEGGGLAEVEGRERHGRGLPLDRLQQADHGFATGGLPRAPAEDEGQGQAVQRLHDVAQEQERPGIGPVDVVDDEAHRPLGTGGREAVDHRGEALEPVRPVRAGGPELGVEAHQLGRLRSTQVAQDGLPGPERRRTPVDPAASGDDRESRATGSVGHLAAEAGLADSRLAGHHGQGAAAGGDVAPGRGHSP
jgi:hypothetical protein